MTDAWPGTPVEAADTSWPGTPAKSAVTPDNQSAPPERSVLDKLVGIGGSRYQLWPERAARELFGLPEKMMTAGAGLPPGSRELSEAQVGPAAETAMATLAPEARVGRAAVKSALAAPSQEELLSVYKPLEQQGTLDIKLQPHVLPELRQNIIDALHDAHFRDYLAPQTFRAIQELEKMENPTVMDIEGVRRLLGNVSPQESKAAAVARDKINDYLSEIEDTDVKGGKNVGQTLAAVRGNYAAGKRSQMVTMANEKGEFAAEASGSGANLDNTLRQQIKGILNNPKKLRGFSKDEIEQMRKIVKGGRIGNIARLLSKLGPKHPITGWSGAIAADLGGGAGAGVATLGTGHLAQVLSEKLTQGRIKALDEAIRRRSPQFQAKRQAAPPPMLAPTVPPLAPFAYRGGIADLISRLGQQDQQ